MAALCEAAKGRKLRRSLYTKLVRSGTGEEVSDNVATRDLGALVSADVLEARGARRGRVYRAGADLRAVWGAIREQRRRLPVGDPYVTLKT